MPKREIQTQNSVRSTKSQRFRRDQKPQSSGDASTTDLSKDHPTNPLKDTPANVPADLSEDHVPDPSMNSSKEPRTELSADNSKDCSTDLSKGSCTDPSRNLSNDHATNNATDLGTKSSEKSPLGVRGKRIEPATNPFKNLSYTGDITYPNKSLSITTTSLLRAPRYPTLHFEEITYPNILDITEAASNYHVEVLELARMTRSDKDIAVEADETDRIQRAFEEFGQLDPYLPASLAAERLANLDLRAYVVEYIVHWAIITNIEVDGDIRYTLLPPHVVALYQDLDRHSSDIHQLLFCQWVQLTFGLLEGGHNGHQASAETGQRVDRIRRFITKLFEPYCVQENEEGVFSERLDQILEWGVALGYNLLGRPEGYRWDWTWLKPKSKELFRLILGTPPPRLSREEVPEGIWITAPALVEDTDHEGQLLAEEITCVEASQSPMTLFSIGEDNGKEGEIDEFEEKDELFIYIKNKFMNRSS